MPKVVFGARAHHLDTSVINPLHVHFPIKRSFLDTALLLRLYWLWPAVVAVCAVAFFSIPGEYNETAHSILHGLCAQTPSHTLKFGGEALPFDSRMTGIYGGFLLTVGQIAGRSRLFWYGNPPMQVMILLGALVGSMAIDGLNSLLADLGMWHPYAPHNAFRIVTGYGAGVALAVVLCWLVASSVWRVSVSRPAVGRLRDLLPPVIGIVGFAVVLLARPGWLHFPVSMLLVISAWVTVTMLVLVIALLTLRLDSKIRTIRQLHLPVAISALLAISVMVALAGGRYWLERTFGITNAMM